jgi:hypothetical protein
MMFMQAGLVNADVEMQFEIRTATVAESAEVQARLTSPNFTSVYESYLDLYGTTFNSTFYNATAVLADNAYIHEVAQLEVGLSGARVNSVVKNEIGDWVIQMQFQSSYNTYTSPFVSRHAVVQNSDELFDSSTHPCLNDYSPCCLLEYTQKYRAGNAFQLMVAEALGDCTDPLILADDTNNLFSFQDANGDPLDRTSEFLTNTFADLQGATTTMDGSLLTITLSTAVLKDSVARVTTGSDGVETISFFVGVTFITMLPTNAVATTVSQMNIEISTKNYIEFATVTSQAFTPVRFTQVSLEQIKYLAGLDDSTEYLPQTAKLLVVLNSGLRDDPAASLIPHESIRWAIDSSMPDITDESLWTIACSDQGYPSEDRAIYTSALAQTCGNQNARDKGVCDESVMTDSSGIGEIYIPLGLNTLTPAILASESLTIFIQFNIMTQDINGKKAVSTMYVQAPLASVSLINSCESLTKQDKVDELTDMHLAVGFATDEATFNSSCTVVDNLISGAGAGKAGFGGDSGVLQAAESYADGLISLYITGDDTFFTPPTYEIFIEDLWTVHTRDNPNIASKTSAITTLFQNSQAFEVATSFNGLNTEVVPQQFLLDSCVNAISCVYRHDIRQRQILNSYAVHDHGSLNRAFDMDATKQWLKGHILGYTPYSDALSQNFTSYIRSRKGVNDRFNKLYFINPTHKWPSVTYANPMDLLLLSDTVFMYGIIVFDDGSGVQRRRLLTVGPEGSSLVPIGSLRQSSLDHGFTRFKRIKAYLEKKLARSNSAKSSTHINRGLLGHTRIKKPTIDSGTRKLIHSLAQKRGMKLRKMLSLGDTSDDTEDATDSEDDDLNDDTTDMEDDDLNDDISNTDTENDDPPGSHNRALLSTDSDGVDGNPTGSYVRLLTTEKTEGLAIATYLGAAENSTWQILKMSFDVTVNKALVSNSDHMERFIYETIVKRFESKYDQIFPGSRSLTMYHMPEPSQLSFGPDWYQDHPGEEIYHVGEIQMLLTWPNGTDLHAVSVLAENIKCAGKRGHATSLVLKRVNPAEDVSTVNYQYCDTSVKDGDINGLINNVMLTYVGAFSCGDLGIVTPTCINVEKKPIPVSGELADLKTQILQQKEDKAALLLVHAAELAQAADNKTVTPVKPPEGFPIGGWIGIGVGVAGLVALGVICYRGGGGAGIKRRSEGDSSEQLIVQHEVAAPLLPPVTGHVYLNTDTFFSNGRSSEC